MEATLDLFHEEPGPPRLSAALCVHFAASGVEHSIWFADPQDSDADSDASRVGRLSVVWREAPAGLLRGYALLGRDVVCDCHLLTGLDPGDERSARDERAALRAQGLSRERADLLVRMPERPLLATAARAADLPPHLARRFHRVLLATAAGCVAAE